MVQRSLEQNREAAGKSRMRKKAYVQQLETSRLKLTQLELELDRTGKQALDKSKNMDGLRVVKKHIQKLEYDLELLKAHAKRNVEFSFDAIEETPEDIESVRVWELLKLQASHTPMRP